MEVVQNSSFVLGRETEDFEKEFAGFCQSRNCVGVSSGSDALFLSLKALGIKPGDEISFLETDAGLLVAPRMELINQLLDMIGQCLQAKGVTLEQLMEDGRKIRGDLLREDYGIDPGDDD